MIHFEGLRFRAITSDMTYSDFQAGCRKGTWERWGWGVGGSRGWGVGGVGKVCVWGVGDGGGGGEGAVPVCFYHTCLQDSIEIIV